MLVGATGTMYPLHASMSRSSRKILLFDLSMVRVDWMHCWHMGVGRDVAGTALKIMATGKHWYRQSTIEKRLRAITRELKAFAKPATNRSQSKA